MSSWYQAIKIYKCHEFDLVFNTSRLRLFPLKSFKIKKKQSMEIDIDANVNSLSIMHDNICEVSYLTF